MSRRDDVLSGRNQLIIPVAILELGKSPLERLLAGTAFTLARIHTTGDQSRWFSVGSSESQIHGGVVLSVVSAKSKTAMSPVGPPACTTSTCTYVTSE